MPKQRIFSLQTNTHCFCAQISAEYFCSLREKSMRSLGLYEKDEDSFFYFFHKHFKKYI